MQIVYHLGVHGTDEERLLRCLLRNRGPLANEGIAVPGPKRYRVLLRDAAAQLRGRPASAQTQSMLLDHILDEAGATRVVFGWEQFMGLAKLSARGAFYPNAGERMRSFTQLFPDADTEFHLAICNPAIFLPAMMAREGLARLAEFCGGTDPRRLRWSDTIADLRRENPTAPVVVWCDEDAPVLWPEVIRTVAGCTSGLPLAGDTDRLEALLRPEGLAALHDMHPTSDPVARRGALADILLRFARPGALEVAVEAQGFDAVLAAELTAAYDADVARIATMPGVRLLSV